MTQNKHGNFKKPIKRLKTKINAANSAENTWQKLKIQGNVMQEDGADLEGLIGLEVLEDYAATLVETGKFASKKATKLNKKVKNQKATAVQQQLANGAAAKMSNKKLKAAMRAEKFQAKLAAAQQERIKKRNERKQQQLVQHDEEEEEDNDEQSEQQSAQTVVKDRFALLRPPAATASSSDDENAIAASEAEDDDDDDEDEEEQAAPTLLSAAALNIDDLERWNGLGVPQQILRAIAEQGFKSPTEIQALTLPAAIMGKKDILGAAETGSGKTLAFGIPILTGIMELKARHARSGIRKAPRIKGVAMPNSEVVEESEMTPTAEELAYYPALSNAEDEQANSQKQHSKKTISNAPLYALVLTPTRELAVQVRAHIIAAAKYTGIKVAAIFGGLSMAKQERILAKCPEIVVATPGRFWELYMQENAHLSKINDISFLVIDETDRMVEKGHFEELRMLLKVLNADESKKQRRQNFIFSATLTLVHDLPEHMHKRNVGKHRKFTKQTSDMKIQSLIEELGISQPKIVDITRSQQTAQTLLECRLLCQMDEKDYYLYYFVQRHPGRTIVFCNSIECVRRLATLFGLLDCQPLPLHANMIQKQRLKNLERFRDNPTGLLIATDVAARGLDIPNVEHVIHYQVPRTSENYVHRSGRTARANKDGITVMFMEPGEVKSYVKLYKTLQRTEDLPLFPVSDRYLAAVKERVNLAREVDKQELKLKRTQSELGWMKKHAEQMDIIIDGYNDESGSEDDEDAFVLEKRRNRQHLHGARLQLKKLLNKPIFPKGFSFKYPSSSGQPQMPEKQSAVNVMQAAIEDMKMAKKMRNKKRKIDKL